LHEVEVKKDGYEEWRETIDVGLGEEAVLNAVLRIRTGSIRVDSGPRGAKIYLDGNYKGATPKTLTGLEPGLHYVVFERDGYEVSKWEVQVEAGENKILKTKLQKLYGSMSVSSVPSSAMIYLDGNNKGVTPTTLTDLEPGLYKVEVKKEGYKDWSKTVDVGSGEEASLNAVLEIMTGSIRVESQPEGAQIYLDGNDKGTTPTTLTDLEPGLYKVEVKEAGVIENGYKEWKETVEVGPGEEVSLNAELLRKTGSIRVESVPRGAGLYLVGDLVKSEPLPEKIYADSSYYGTTPKTLTDLGPGSYKVAVKKGGYIDWVKKVYVEAGEETLLQVILQQQYGSISVSSAPASAKIYLDGNDKGITPATLTDLEPGSYKVEVKKEGYTDWSETVDVGSDKEVSLNAVLEIMTGSIRVKSEPIGAEIYLLDAEGEVLLRDTLRTTHNSLTDLKPGSYIVEVKKDGYEEWRETVDVGPGEDIPINVVLLKVKPLIVAKQSELWECNEFTFDATSSFDSDNMALSYHWDFGDGNVSDQPIATHRFKQGGDFNVILSVQDNSRLDCDSSVASHIVHVNTPPVADAGPNHVCCLGVVSDFDGSGSFDADGDNLSYSWDFGDGNTGEGVNTTHVYDEPGRYNGTLNVNDNSGTHCENSIVSFIAVLNAKPTSIIKFKETQTYNEFIFDATSSFDPNNQVINYHWDFGDGNVSDKPVVTHRFPWEGDYNVLLSVQDNSGLECDTAVSSQVVHVSTPPIANAEKIINLRSSYKNLSTSQVQSMSNISIREKDDYGFYGHSTIKHDYELKSSDGEKVVIDHATGLMWHQSGSVDTMEWNTIFGLNPKKWLKKLNRRGYAGYHDWRLPTVEEAASLLESSEKNGKLYIDPLFSDKQWYIWTGDKKNGSEAVWCVRFVRFDSGVSCNYLHSLSYDGFVRPVRSVTQ
jgi:PKD repeat protein/uncharacterized protein (UPF0548 family)